MIDRRTLAQFLSGRLTALVVLLTLQVAIVRGLPTSAYGDYALTMAAAMLLQTLTSLGLPRVTAKFLSRAGAGVTRRDARVLALTVLNVRTLLTLAVLVVGVALWRTMAPQDLDGQLPLLIAGAAYALATTWQFDADGMAQALSLQGVSRSAAIGEPVLRLAGVLAAFFLDRRGAATIVGISAMTAALASVVLIFAVFGYLSSEDEPAEEAARLDWAMVRRTAFGGYSGTLAWLAFSPATLRLIASRVLPVEAFAGFSFVQALVGSLQRYAPSFILFPLVEPRAMAEVAANGDARGLKTTLSLLVRIDAITVGAAIVGAAAGGAPVLLAVTHGRYGDAAPFLPWLLALIVVNASHRSYEIAAIAMNASAALIQALGASLIWLIVVLALTPMFGVWPLLLCPIGDAVTRLCLVQRALDQRGAKGLLAGRALAVIAALAAGFSLVSASVASAVRGGLAVCLGVGAVAAAGFVAAVLFGRLLSRAEIMTLGSPIEPPASSLRVLVLTPRGEGGTGGVDRLMDALRPRLAKRSDLSVTYIVTRGDGLRPSLFVALRALIQIARIALTSRADVLHINLGAHGGCYRKMALMALPRLCGTPYVLHLHGSAFEAFWNEAPPFLRRRIDRLFADAAKIVVLGQHWFQIVTAHAPEAADRVLVLPNAAPAIRRTKAPGDGMIRLLFLGELGPRKGVSVLIEALALLKTTRAWRVVIAGDGDIESLRRSVVARGLSARVDMPGWVGPTEVEALLAKADVLTLPSFEENLPMAVIEAFAAGIAVVATPVGAVSDLVEEGRTGLLVKPGDAAGLAAALDRLIDDPDLRRRLGQAAKIFHEEHLAIEPYAERLIHFWRAAAAKVDPPTVAVRTEGLA